MNNKKTGLIFYICAVLFCVAALITFIFGENKTMGTIWLCLGSSWLCLGTVFANKAKKEDEDKIE